LRVNQDLTITCKGDADSPFNGPLGWLSLEAISPTETKGRKQTSCKNN
jgi:hypothetical protein